MSNATIPRFSVILQHTLDAADAMVISAVADGDRNGPFMFYEDHIVAMNEARQSIDPVVVARNHDLTLKSDNAKLWAEGETMREALAKLGATIEELRNRNKTLAAELRAAVAGKHEWTSVPTKEGHYWYDNCTGGALITVNVREPRGYNGLYVMPDGGVVYPCRAGLYSVIPEPSRA